MDLSLFQNCPPLSSVMLDCLCCFHLISNFRSFSKEHIFYEVGLSAPCPTPNLENQGIPYCLVHHLWPFWHGRPCQKLCYHQHSSQIHLTTQDPPLRKSRNTFGGISVTLLFHISGKQNVRLFRETWHPMDTPADGSPFHKKFPGLLLEVRHCNHDVFDTNLQPVVCLLKSHSERSRLFGRWFDVDQCLEGSVSWPLQQYECFSKFHNHAVCCGGGGGGDYDDYVKILKY